MATGTYRDLLRNKGLECFLWTQFLGALNDNLHTFTVSLLAVHIASAPGEAGKYLAITGGLFMIPFFLFSGHAGQFADIFSKRSVLVATKCFELVVMILGLVAFASGSIGFLFGIVLLMALHSAFFSPAKYGILPEMLPARDLSRANGLLEMSTFAAIILGTSAGGVLVQAWLRSPARIGVVLIGIAAAGALASLGIERVPAAAPAQHFRWNAWAEIGEGIRHLKAERPLFLSVIGISWFWFLGALFKMDLVLLGKHNLHAGDARTGALFTFMAVGIAAGSLAAGRLSGDRIELGLVPLGSFGMGSASLALVAASGSYRWTAACIVALGFFGGLFVVPLNAYLQQRSGAQEKGRLMATNNFLNTVAVLFASGALLLFGTLLKFPPERIILVFGLMTLAATIYIATLVPGFLLRFLAWALTRTIYRIRVLGLENLPAKGPALLVSNHLSLIDGFLVGASVDRWIRFLVYRPYFEKFGWAMRHLRAIPIAESEPKRTIGALRRARQELLDSHMVCVFAEGSVSRTGNLLPFKAGFERIVRGLDNVPIIPVHLDRVWGSIFSFKKGRFFWKWPDRFPYPVTVSFGKPLPAATPAWEVRQAVMELGVAAVEHRRTPRDLLHLRFLRTAKRRWFALAMADSTGARLSYGKALVASLLVASRIRKRPAEEVNIGLLLPASVAGAVGNAGVLLAGRVPVNLNFTAGASAMHSAIEQCGIRTILTSRSFLSRTRIEPRAGMTFVEDLFASAGRLERAALYLAALLPARIVGRWANPGRRGPHSLATIVFSSGSTGVPKGIMLSHHNVISNIESLDQIFCLTPKDRFIGILPFFHSFGFTCTLWFPLVCGRAVVYHPNPLDAAGLGRLTAAYRATFLLSTPSLYSTYTRKCAVAEFASLRFACAGGERLPEQTARAFRDKFGLGLSEGYGCTEMGPVVAVNLSAAAGVGHPIPGVAVKVVDAATGATLAPESEGLLLVKGPSRMMGYLNDPARTAAAMRDGWYETGDIASIDGNGFIRITDRLSRFSKIGGEMVPHGRVEDAVNTILGGSRCLVTSVADDRKGERLVVLYTGADIAPPQLWTRLIASDLPNLWLPKPSDLHRVDELPVTGTGKLDLRRAREIARSFELEEDCCLSPRT